MKHDHFVRAAWHKERRKTAVSDKVIFNIAVPIILSSATGTLLNIVDTIMVGQYGADQLAAVAIAGTALGVFNVFAGALSVGVTASIARALGAANSRQAGQIAWTGIACGLAFGFLITLAWFFLNTPTLVFLGAKGELLSQAETYLGIVKYTIALGILNGMWNSLHNANSYTKPLVFYTIIVNLVHLTGNFLLIYGNLGFPRMGVKGAAISTVIATLAGFAFSVTTASLARKRLNLIYTAGINTITNLLPPVLKLSLPTIIEWGVWTIGIFFVNKFIAEYGAKQIAVYHVSMKIQGFFMLALSGFGTASVTLIGQSFGAKNAYHIYAWNKRILTLSLLITSVGAALCILFPNAVMRVFMNARDVLTLNVSVPLVMLFCGLLIPLRTINIVCSSALRTMGDISYFAKVQPAGLVIMVGLSWFFLTVLHTGVIGVFYAMMVDETIRAALVILRFRNLAYHYFLAFHADKAIDAAGSRASTA